MTFTPGATPSEAMVAGDVVNTASRLQTSAPVNGVLVGEETYRSTRTVIAYEPVEALTVKGKIASKNPLISRLAHGRGYVFFQRFDTKAKRWKKVSRYSRDAKHAFTLLYTFKKRGVWRVTGRFKPKTGFKAARAKASKKFKV